MPEVVSTYNLAEVNVPLQDASSPTSPHCATLMRYYTRVNATRRRQATDHIAQLMSRYDA